MIKFSSPIKMCSFFADNFCLILEKTFHCLISLVSFNFASNNVEYLHELVELCQTHSIKNVFIDYQIFKFKLLPHHLLGLYSIAAFIQNKSLFGIIIFEKTKIRNKYFSICSWILLFCVPLWSNNLINKINKNSIKIYKNRKKLFWRSAIHQFKYY